MTTTSRDDIKCPQCGAIGVMKLRENDAPFSSRWEQYSFEGNFTGGTTNPPMGQFGSNDNSAFWNAMNCQCTVCGRKGAPEIIKKTYRQGNPDPKPPKPIVDNPKSMTFDPYPGYSPSARLARHMTKACDVEPGAESAGVFWGDPERDTLVDLPTVLELVATDRVLMQWLIAKSKGEKTRDA